MGSEMCIRDSNYSASAKLPFIKGKPFGVELEISKQASLEPVNLQNQSVNYLYDKDNFRLSGLYYVTPRNTLKLTGAFFTEEYSVDGENVNGFPSDFLHRKYLFSQEFFRNNETYFYHLVSGYSVFLNFTQVINLDAEGDFNLVLAQYKYYHRIKKRSNVAFRAKTGIATNTDSPFAPFAVSYTHLTLPTSDLV